MQKLIREHDMPPKPVLEIDMAEFRTMQKLDKLPDVLREYGYPDVQAFMATYRKAEAVVEQYSRDLAAWERQVREKEKPVQKSRQHHPGGRAY